MPEIPNQRSLGFSHNISLKRTLFSDTAEFHTTKPAPVYGILWYTVFSRLNPAGAGNTILSCSRSGKRLIVISLPLMIPIKSDLGG